MDIFLLEFERGSAGNQCDYVIVTHCGEEHGEDVDRSLQQVVAPHCDGHWRDEHQVAETKQQGGEELEAVGVGLRVVRASPAFPA